MAILNPSFEDAGAVTGEAEHWTLVTATTLERIAGFGPAPHEACEGFERWFDLALVFGLFVKSCGRIWRKNRVRCRLSGPLPPCFSRALTPRAPAT